MEEPFVSSSRGFMQGFYQIMAGWFWDIELVFEVQGIVSKFTVSLGGSRDPGSPCLVIHGSKGLDYYGVKGGGGGNLFCEDRVNGTDMVILVVPLEQGDFLVIIVHVHFILLGECIGGSHIDSVTVLVDPYPFSFHM